jgi:hypothetical protein
MISEFMERVTADPRISSAHISLYVALWKKAIDKGDINTEAGLHLIVFRNEMRDLCNISSGRTYFLCMQQLAEYGYLEYEPSFSRFKGSKVKFIKFGPKPP